MGKLQHNKTIVVDGPKVQAVVCGSTNFTLARVLRAVQQRRRPARREARSSRSWRRSTTTGSNDDAARLRRDRRRRSWTDLGLDGIDAQVAFSPHATKNALLQTIADDIGENTTSSLFYSLAFLYQTPGADPRRDQEGHEGRRRSSSTASPTRRSAASTCRSPTATSRRCFPRRSTKNVPEPFKSEPTGRRRQPHAPQVRRHRLRQADRARLSRLLQLLRRRRTPRTARTCC